MNDIRDKIENEIANIGFNLAALKLEKQCQAEENEILFLSQLERKF